MKWKIPEGYYLVLRSKGGDDDVALVRLNGTNGIGKWESMNIYRALGLLYYYIILDC